MLPAEIAAPPSDPVDMAPIDAAETTTSVIASENESRRELVVIDGRLDNADALFADLRSKGSDNVQFDVLLLNDHESGAAQISRMLDGYAGDLDALHILSHGGEEGLLLGSDWFTQADLSDPGAGVGSWQRAFTGEADLLLYGCNLAATDDGRAFLSDLADLTGADVAASDDLTGGTGSGGDWQLEYQHGRIETTSALSAAARASFAGTLDGTAIWSEFNVPTPQTSELNGATLDPETNTANIGGPWRTMDGAEAPTRDEKIVVGVDENGDLSGQMWDGANWTAFAFNDFSNVSDVHRWGFAVAYESQSGDAMLVYNNGTTGANNLSFRTWDGSSWSSETVINTGFSGEPAQMKLAASPHSDEMVLIWSSAGNEDHAMVWDGDTWGNTIYLSNPTGAASNTDVSVAYEQQSGDAMVIYGKGDQNAYYRMWNGSWGGESSIPAHASVTGVTQWTTAASDPNSDRIIMGALTSDNDVFFNVWNGSSWEASELATTVGAGTGTYGLAVAFESQSGDAMAMYSKFDSSVYYKTWSGGSWSGEAVAYDVGFLNVTSTITLTSDPGSDRIMATTLDSMFDVNFALWDGDAWGTPTEVEGSAGTFIGQPFLFLWDEGSPAAGSGESFWISTRQDVSGAGTAGVTSWDNEDVLEISDVQIEPGLSGGTFSIAVNFANGAKTDAVHYVSQDMMVAGFQLKAGDLLMSLDSTGILNSTAPVLDVGFTNSLSQTDRDVFVYRPVAPGDYSDGTFAILLEDPAGGNGIHGITLIESITTIGDYTADAGDFLFTRSGTDDDEDVWVYETSTVGAGNTTGSARKLLEGDVFGIDRRLHSIELLETATMIGGRSFAAGTLLATVNNTDTLGTNNVSVAAGDIFALHVSATELVAGVGNSSATAELVFEGADAGIADEWIDAFTLVGNAASNTPPSIGGFQLGQTVDDDQTISPFSAVTLDDADGNALSVKIQLDEAGKGTLSGGGFADLGGGLYEFTGSAAAAQTAMRSLVFDPSDNRVAPGLTETTTFSVTVSDGIDPVADSTTTVISTSVNDPSSIGGTVSNQAVNDNATVAPFSTVTIADPDAENVVVDVQLDTAAKGVLSGGGFADLGGGHYQFTGTAAAAQTAIRALVFDPTDNRVAPGLTETTTFDITVTDAGGPVSNNATSVISTSVNDPSAIGGTVANQAVNDNATVAPFSTVTIADPDAENVVVDVQLDDGAKGVLTGGGFTDMGGGHYQFTGTAAAAQTAIRALVFDPTENRVAPGSTETTTFDITLTDAGGPVSNNASSVISTSINDASTIGGTLANQAVNDNATVAPFSTVTIADPDAENVVVDVQLDDGAKGVLSGGGFADLGGGHYQFTGTAAAAQTAIRALVFDPTDNRVAPGLTETTTFDITVTDAGGPVSNNATSVISTSVNDASTIGGAVTGQTVNDDQTIALFSTITITDPDAESVVVEVQIDVAAKGVLSGGGFTDLGGGRYQFTGTAAAAQTAIRALVFDPTENRVAPGLTETSTFSISVTDSGGPVFNTATTVISTSVGDPASIGGAVANQPVDDDQSVAPFSAVTIADPDGETLTVDVRLDDGAKGILTGGGFSDLGGGQYQFTGTAAAAQTAIRALVFDPTENRVAPGLTETTGFSITVTDSSGPVINNITSVVATSINDPSAIGGTVANQAVNDNATVAPFSTVTIADPDVENVVVDVQLDDGAKGVLTGGGFTDLGGGRYQFTGTAAAAQTAIRALVFDPTENRVAPGLTETTTFDITVTDAGGPVSNNATSVIATSINDASAIGGTVANQAVNDNATVAPFSTVTITDPDAENVVVDVQLDDGAKGVLTGGGFTDMGGGHYQFSGTAAAAQTAIRALVFDPTEDRVAPGLTETTTFDITVTDAAGPVSNNATTVISTSVGDPAVIGGAVANQPVDDNASVAPFGGITITDPDGEVLTVDVRLDDGAKGVLAGVGFTDLGGGQYQFTGTAAAAQTAIRALVFSPTENRVAPGQTETTSFDITVTDSSGPVVNSGTTVVSTSVNDATVIGGTVTGLTAKDTVTVMPFSTVTLSDPDSENLIVEVRLDDGAKGTLAGGGFAALGGGVYQFTGTAAAAESAIRNLVFTPTANRVLPGLTETTQFTIDVQDTLSASYLNAATSVITESVNDAPTLANATPAIPGLSEDDVSNNGVAVSTLLGASLSDPDVLSVEGIAVTTANSLNGVWEYSLNGGANWSALNGTSTSAAKLLRATDLVRFRPDGMNAGGGNLAFHGWDRTQGAAGGVVDASVRGGETPFSIGGNVASVATSAVNDAPGAGLAVVPPLANGSANPMGERIATLLGGQIGDVDAASSLAGVAVVNNGTAGWPGGNWQYSTDGVNWSDVGTVGDDASALVLHANTRVRFVPQPGYTGNPPPLMLRAVDNTYAGGFSTTNGGVENRANVDASIHGGITALSGNYSAIGASIGYSPPVAPPVAPPAPDVIDNGDDSGAEPENTTVNPGHVAPLAETEGGSERLGRGILDEAQREAPVAREDFRIETAPAEAADASATLQADSPAVRALVERLIEKVLPDVSLQDLLFASAGDSLLGELDAMREQFEGAVEIEQTVVGSAFAVTTGLSVGYVVWLTRGGLLLASLVSSMPAWQLMDPTPILASLAGGGMADDGESLEELLENENEKDEEDAAGSEEPESPDSSPPARV